MYRTLFDPDEIPADIREFFEETSAACGAPWIRVVERETLFLSGSGRAGHLPSGKGRPADGQIREGHDIRMGNTSSVTTTGWRAGCECNAEVVPCTVLDPFSGAGTTALVADRLGRHAIGIDLSHAYVEMARERLVADCPLFAELSPPPATYDAEDQAMADLFAWAAK